MLWRTIMKLEVLGAVYYPISRASFCLPVYQGGEKEQSCALRKIEGRPVI